MRFTTGSLILSIASVSVSVSGLPLESRQQPPSGCHVDLAPTLSQPQNAASNILYHTLSKWASTSESSYVSSDILDMKNTPYSVTFKTNVDPNFQTAEQIGAVLEKWVGTYLVGGETAEIDDYAITGFACS
ncbi:hypothetical protein GGS20DRAFT_585443 [Poronia punctata]|nr:hypothetical protein GGS20DRAFT_585443 [Poronia punctata]